MPLHFGTMERASVALLVGLVALLVSHSTIPGESFFWTFAVTIAVAAFLLVKPEMRLLDKFRRVHLWDVLAPCVLMVFVMVKTPQNLPINILRLVFAVIFCAGIGTALRLFIWERWARKKS